MLQEDVVSHLSGQEREDITFFCQEAVRKIHYGSVRIGIFYSLLIVTPL